MSEKKIVTINPNDFSFNTGSRTRKTRDKNNSAQSSSKIKVKPISKKPREDTLKKKAILKMIRQQQEERFKRQQNTNDEPKPQISSQKTNDVFTEAKEFMQNIVEKQKTLRKTQTLKNYTSASTPATAFSTTPNIPTLSSVELKMPVHNTDTMRINSATEPRYGCLKNGVLPTYRTYMNQTRKMDNSVHTQHQPIISNTFPKIPIHINQETSQPMPSQKENVAPLVNYQRPPFEHQTITKIYQNNLNEQKKKGFSATKRKKTIRRKYMVGKSKVKPTVSVLVSNRTLRRNITTDRQLLKQVPIQEIRKYLIKHGFIKVGTITPSDVLREMYEAAKTICGDVQNHNPETLLFNFMNTTD